jgi:hypothetical protein
LWSVQSRDDGHGWGHGGYGGESGSGKSGKSRRTQDARQARTNLRASVKNLI